MTKTAEIYSPDKRNMTKRALATAWPAMAESFFVTLAGMIDTMMVSGLGTSAVAAVGLTTQPKFISLTLFFGLNVAISALVARRKGEERQEEANKVFLTALALAVALCAAVTVLFVALADPMMKLAGSDQYTHKDAVAYFRIIEGGMIFNVLTMAINSAQRGSGNTRLSMYTNLTSSVVNVIFNAILIPKYQLVGAAVATVLGTVVSAGMAIFSITRRSSYVSVQLMRDRKLRPNKSDARSIWHLTYNTSLENIAMRVGFLATALIAARLHTDPAFSKDIFALHNVEMQLLGLGFAFADGMQVAAIALTGESLGAGRKQEAKDYGRICQRIGLVISVILSLLLLVGGRWFTGLFLNGETSMSRAELLAMGTEVNYFIMVIVLLQISQIIFSACLRAAGDVRYTLVGALISVAGIRTAVTLLLFFFTDLGLIGVWIGILSDQLSRFLLMGHRFRKGNWVNLKI